MALTSTSTSGFSNLLHEVISKRMAELQRAALPYASQAHDPINIAEMHFVGENAYFRVPVFADITPQTANLTEGVAPTAQALTIDSETFTATQQGDLLGITDLAEIMSPVPLVGTATERLSRMAAVRVDNIVQAAFTAKSGITTILPSTYTATAQLTAADTFSGLFLKTLVAKLRNANVAPCSDGLFHSIISPSMALALATDTAKGGPVEQFEYLENQDAQDAAILGGSIGIYGGVKFWVTTRIASGTTTAAGYGYNEGYIFGANAFAIGGVQSLATFFNAGGGPTDPLYQAKSIGYKLTSGSGLLVKPNPRLLAFDVAALTL